MKPITGKASFSVLLGGSILDGHVLYWTGLYVTNSGVYK